MTLHQAEQAINQVIDLRYDNGRRFYTASTWIDKDEPYVAVSESKSDCLNRLVDYIYMIFGLIALERAEYRCESCGRFAGLQRHHRKPRDRGRDDHPDNLKIECWRCHNADHEG